MRILLCRLNLVEKVSECESGVHAISVGTETYFFLSHCNKTDICLFDFILYVPSTIFLLNRVESSWA